MTEKATYSAEELADKLNIHIRKVQELIRKGKIKHIHTNNNHTNVRIPHDEFWRIVTAKDSRAM